LIDVSQVAKPPPQSSPGIPGAEVREESPLLDLHDFGALLLDELVNLRFVLFG
jgi:hypothetical protein